MRSVLLLIAWGATSHASETCTSGKCNDADVNSLLQARSLIRQHRAQVTDANALLKSMHDVASSFTKGSAVTMTPAEVTAALGTAETALQAMLPMFEEQHDLAHREIQHSFGALQACHNEHGGEVRARLEHAVASEFAATEQCEQALSDAVNAEHEACEGQGDDPNCLCNEAREAITHQTALCVAVTQTYEAVFCEQHISCTSLHECHAQALEVFNEISADLQAAMISRQQEYSTFMQVDCLMNLITTAMSSGTPIDNAALVACSDVNVDHLTLDFPDVPPAPSACPESQIGNPQCGEEEEREPTFIGCFVDDGSRDLEAGPRAYGHTIASCSTACGSYSHFALQNNGWCVCGNEYGTESQYTQVPDTQCGNACAGDSRGRCGAGWRNAVYSVAGRPDPDYVGCFVDDGSRDLESGPTTYGYTRPTCAEACASFPFFALQHNGWCVCGNAYGTASQYSQVDDNQCGSPCAGETDGHCGGGWRNAVYSTHCRHLHNQDVVAGTFQHFGADHGGSASDAACSASCTALPACTAWVRQPSSGRCWLSSQSVVAFNPQADRNAGLRCN